MFSADALNHASVFCCGKAPPASTSFLACALRLPMRAFVEGGLGGLAVSLYRTTACAPLALAALGRLRPLTAWLFWPKSGGQFGADANIVPFFKRRHCAGGFDRSRVR